MPMKNNATNINAYLSNLTDLNTTHSPFPLKDQHSIQLLTDILCRKWNHHALVYSSRSALYNTAFLQQFSHHLVSTTPFTLLKEATLLSLDWEKLSLECTHQTLLANSLSEYCNAISAEKGLKILAINACDALNFPEIQLLLGHPKWRIVILTAHTPNIANKPTWKNHFSDLTLHEPTASDATHILKSFRDELELYHHVIIPDETFPYAYTMANQFLNSAEAPLEKALKLLDSSAARTSANERTDAGHPSKPILTQTVVAKTISQWAQIPLTHLQQNKFKANDFIQYMQKNIFGQETAINQISLVLQYARIKLRARTGPLCSFLFAGPPHVGKSETALAIAEQLFGQRNSVIEINLDKKNQLPLSQLKVTRKNHERQHVSLFEAIQASPYAVVLFKNIDQGYETVVDLLHDIFSQGYATDEEGKQYDFKHAIIVLTTHLGSERIIQQAMHSSEEAEKNIDLIQLVLNEQKIENPQQAPISPQEMCEEMMPTLDQFFSQSILRHLNIIPFGPLDYASLEKIIRLKLKVFAMQLDAQYGLELNYAPEIIRFLVQETLWRGSTIRPIDKVLEQHLYSSVAHELVNTMDEKNRPKRLLLQLNESGNLLRCEFIAPGDAVLYKL